MIRYALICKDCETAFEAWFANSQAYDVQKENHQISCAACSGHNVTKQIMAPAVRTSKKSSNILERQKSPSADLIKAARDHIAATHDYTGTDFAVEARAMHYGEIKHRPIWGETTSEEAKSLYEEGVEALPLPAPLAPRPPKDKSKLN
jgi:hypothetical protein